MATSSDEFDERLLIEAAQRTAPASSRFTSATSTGSTLTSSAALYEQAVAAGAKPLSPRSVVRRSRRQR